MRNTRTYSGAIVVCIGLYILSSCGGGTSNNPDPAIDPVEEITLADLATAGVPGLPADTHNPAGGISYPTLQRVALATEPVASSNVIAAGDGESARVYIDEIPSGVVAGWAVYKISAATESPRVALALESSLTIWDYERVFFAVGNYSLGRWEVGGRIIATELDAGFTLNQDYLSPQGNFYVVIAVGRSGRTDPADYTASWGDLTLTTAQLQTTVSIFADGWEATMEPGGPGVYNITIIDGILNPLMRINYDDAFVAYFVPEMGADFGVTRLAGNDNEWRWLWKGGVPELTSGGMLSQIMSQEPGTPPLIMFYNDNEMNGFKHPFTVSTWASGDWNADQAFGVNAVEYHLDESLTARLKGVMTGMEGGVRGPAAGATLKLLTVSEELIAETTTGSDARFTFDFTFPQTGSQQVVLETSKGAVTERLLITAILDQSQGEGEAVGWLRFESTT